MGDPPREEHSCTCMLQVGRVVVEVGKEVAGMIERHDDHDDTPENVDGDDAFVLCGRHR